MNVESLTLVIPVYNSSSILPSLIERLAAVFQVIDVPVELILVNDGSQDGSWSVIEDLAQRFSWLLGVDLIGNFGQHHALFCGILLAKHEIIVTLDDDLQHPPEEIPKLLDALLPGVDVVYGVAMQRRHAVWRIAASRIMEFIVRLQAPNNQYRFSSFRAFRASVFSYSSDIDIRRVTIDGILAMSTTKFATVPVQHHKRLVGESNYDFRRLLELAFNYIASFGLIPKPLVSSEKRLIATSAGRCLCSLYLSQVIAKTTVANSAEGPNGYINMNRPANCRACEKCGNRCTA